MFCHKAGYLTCYPGYRHRQKSQNFADILYELCLVANLRTRFPGQVRSVDVKPLDEWYQVFDDVDNQVLDLRLLDLQ